MPSYKVLDKLILNVNEVEVISNNMEDSDFDNPSLDEFKDEYLNESRLESEQVEIP